jgi:hypothetical protein
VSWSSIGKNHPGPRRENYLSVFAPLSLLLLLALWVAGSVIGFALIEWGMQVLFAPQGHLGFFVQLYVSTTTFVTLGLGDLTPLSPLGRFLTGIEAIAGFGFLALTRGAHLDARSMGGVAADVHGAAPSLGDEGQPVVGRSSPRRLGTVGIGAPRESSVVSRARVLPLAT